jgi:hypothetical protein
MKKAATLVAVVIAIALCSVGAEAQAMLKANIPFDFSIGNTQLQSGTYIVSQAGSEVEILRNESGKSATMFLTNLMENPKADSTRYVLEFQRHGDEYILAEVWTGQVGHAVRGNEDKLKLAKADSTPTLIAMEVVK